MNSYRKAALNCLEAANFISLMLEKPRSLARYYEIDLLRFIAAISVVLYHYTFWGHATSDTVNPLAFASLSGFTRYGYLGVQLFFIISGFVILLSSEKKTVREFFVSRVVRLFPAFCTACTLTVLVQLLWASNSSAAFIPNTLRPLGLTYVANMTMLHEFIGAPHVDGAYWSLTIEITFYFLVAVLIGFKLMRHLDLFIVLLLSYALIYLKLSYPGALFAVLLFPNFSPFFAAGMLFYMLREQKGRTWLRYFLLLLSYLLAIQSGIAQANGLAIKYSTSFSPLAVSALITSFFLAFSFIVFGKWRFNKTKWLAWAGALTYPLYLLHGNIGYVIFQRTAQFFDKYLILTGTILLMLILGGLIHILVEKRYSSSLGVLLNRILARLDKRGAVDISFNHEHSNSGKADRKKSIQM